MFLLLPDSFQKNNPEKRVIKLGIGDVTRPIVPAVIEAMHKAIDEMGNLETFRGYGPEQGYEFLREKIVKNDYATRGVEISPDEIFVSDGAKCDSGNIGDIFDVDNVIAVCDPVYPVYVDSKESIEKTVEAGIDKLEKQGILEKGDTVVVTGGSRILPDRESKTISGIVKI